MHVSGCRPYGADCQAGGVCVLHILQSVTLKCMCVIDGSNCSVVSGAVRCPVCIIAAWEVPHVGWGPKRLSDPMAVVLMVVVVEVVVVVHHLNYHRCHHRVVPAFDWGCQMCAVLMGGDMPTMLARVLLDPLALCYSTQ